MSVVFLYLVRRRHIVVVVVVVCGIVLVVAVRYRAIAGTNLVRWCCESRLMRCRW